MTKAEEYTFQKARGRHPTFLEDLKPGNEKKITTVTPNVTPVRNVNLNDRMWTPTNPATDTNLQKQGKDIFKADIWKKIWG
jgi:hypothetical protein